MKAFWTGFEKKAEENRGWLAPTLGAAAAGLGTYGLMRGGGTGRLVKTLMVKKPKTGLGRLGQRLIHGADEIAYTPTTVAAAGRFPKTPKKLEGTVLHEFPSDIRRFKGDKNVGGISQKAEAGFEDKFRESKLLNAVAPQSHMQTELGAPIGKLQGQMKGDYLLKERGGFASGVGGGGFLSKQDIERHVAGYKLPPQKEKMLAKYKRNPSKFLQQEKIDIEKGRFSGAPREMRVHVVNGEVVPGATIPRGKNVEDYFSTGKAEAAMREAVKNMPDSQKKNLTMAADVAMTKDGPKILELNRGAHQSGLLDPNYLWEAHGKNPILGLGAAGAATKANQAIYRHMTGRHSELTSGLAGLGTGLGAGGLIRSRQRE